MPLYDKFFYLVLFFLAGVALASLKINFWTAVLAAASLVVLFFIIYRVAGNKKLLALSFLSLVIIAGSFYFLFYQYNFFQNSKIIFDKKISFTGTVVAYPQRGASQQLAIELEPPYAGKVLVKLKPYPSFNYGDRINFEGTVKKQDGSYGKYLQKEKIIGTADFPKTELVFSGHGSKIKSFLFSIKSSFVSTFQKTLNPEQAAFMSGILVGERAEFSKEFKDAMSKSGTTHLVALSGFNITIIAGAVALLFGSFLKRSWTLYLSVLFIVLFVLMTGAESSSVRAAIMGIIVIVAKLKERIYSVRNSIAAAAFLMVLFNPFILLFDLGFQLSFLALIGIVYLSPLVKNKWQFFQKESFLDWRQNLLTTASAQLAVAPVLILSFNNFSPLSLISNVLILEAVPPTMFLGFLAGLFNLFFSPLALITSWLTSLFLSYEIFIINLFSKIYLPIKNIGVPGALIYYALLTIGMIYLKKGFSTDFLKQKWTQYYNFNNMPTPFRLLKLKNKDKHLPK